VPKKEERVRTISASSTGSTGSGMGTPERKTSSVYTDRTRTFSTGSTRVVLLAVDASENSQMAWDWYMENMQRSDDALVIVHIPEPPHLPFFKLGSGMNPPVEEWKKIIDETNEKTRKIEEDYENTCIQKKMKYKFRGESSKKPGEEIIRIGEEEMVDFVIMGTRGMGSVKKAFLGSVSDYVVRNASMPVIIIPGKKYKQRRASMIDKRRQSSESGFLRQKSLEEGALLLSTSPK